MAFLSLETPPLILPSFLLSLLGLWIATVLLYGLYNLTLHPLRSYPGPLLHRAYRIPHTLSILRGTPHLDVLALHKRYGPVVRLAPAELSYTTSAAIKELYGHYSLATHGFTELDKDRQEYGKPMQGPYSILGAYQDDHARFRRLLSPGFSEKGLRDAQARIQGYVDLLIKGLREEGEGGAWQDMRQWFNWTTFDLIGDLAFGESFGCLESRTHNEWVDAVFKNVKRVPLVQTLERYGLGPVMGFFVPKSLKEGFKTNFLNSVAKMNRRIPKGSSRGDFMDNVLLRSDAAKGTGMTVAEMVNNASTLVLGGSETTATLLSGTVFLLLKHPAVLQKLNEEVRSAFNDEKEIDLMSVGKLHYMGAVLDEAMRVYPPVPNMGNRVVPAPGLRICGKWVPGGTSVGAPQYPTHHLASNFVRPDEFLPERWLGDSAGTEFEHDDRAARQPFSLGTRNCIGQNLAYAEMRLILARVCWGFDMELDEERSGDWMEQKVFVLWEKGELWVRVKAVGGS